MDRRTFLRAAASVGVVGVAGCQHDGDDTPAPTRTPDGTLTSTPSPTRTATRTTPTDDSRLTAVQVDVAPGDEVSDVVHDVARGQLLVFPSGRFTWSGTASVTIDDWGIRCQEDTVFEVPTGTGDGGSAALLATHDGDRTADNVLLENLTFDSSGRAAPGLHLGVRTAGHVDGLHYRMDGPLSDQRHENGVQAFVENPEGRLRIDDYRQFNNGDLGAYGGSDSRIGIWVGWRNEGTVHLRNPVLQGFPNNACYVSRQPGTVVVDGGLLLNNNVSAVRVSGGVEVRDTTVYIDVDRYLEGPGTIEAPEHNTRGLWGDNRQAGTDGGLVRGSTCILRSYRRSGGLATILENPWMTLRDCQFLLDQDIACIRAHAGEIRVDDCEFAGDATGATAGVGDISGSGGEVAANIDPGDVPVLGIDPEFDWSATHPETPTRPTPPSTDDSVRRWG